MTYRNLYSNNKNTSIIARTVSVVNVYYTIFFAKIVQKKLKTLSVVPVFNLDSDKETFFYVLFIFLLFSYTCKSSVI